MTMISAQPNLQKWIFPPKFYLEVSAGHFHALGRYSVLSGAEDWVEGTDVVEDTRHLVVEIWERVESSTVHVIPWIPN